MRNERLVFRGDEVDMDPDNFRSIDDFLSRPISLKVERSKGGEFICGPIPVSWIKLAAEVSPAAAYVGILLWHLIRLRKGPVTMTYAVSLRYGLCPRTVHRLLRGLANAGLVRLEFNGRRAVRVSLVKVKGEGPPTIQ
jgi:hypothetical protein